MPSRVPHNPTMPAPRPQALTTFLCAFLLCAGCSTGRLVEQIAATPPPKRIQGQLRVSENLPAAVVEDAIVHQVKHSATAAKSASLESVQPTIIAPPPPPYSTVDYPTIIHTVSTVAVAVPDVTAQDGAKTNAAEAETRKTGVRVVLRRSHFDSASGQAQFYESAVKRGRGTFHNLPDGAYDVFYVTGDPNTSAAEVVANRNPDRRIIVQSPDSPLLSSIHSSVEGDAPLRLVQDVSPEHSRFEADAAVSASMSLGQAVTMDAIQDRSARGWELLSKRSLYAALEQFQSAIHEVGKRMGNSSESEKQMAATDWQNLLDGKTDVATSIRTEQLDPAELAKKLTEYVGGQKGMASTFRGLGRTYDAIGQSPRPLIRDAEGLAVLAYMTAMALDPESFQAANDLGVLCHRLGWLENAKSNLTFAAERSQDAVAAYNLGRVYWDAGQPMEAEKWWRTAIDRDDRLAPAHLEFVRCVLRSGGLALYPQDCQSFAQSLNRIVELRPKGAPESVWASSVLQRLQLVGRELELNDDGLVHRQWLGRYSASVIDVAARGIDSSGSNATAVPHDSGPILPAGPDMTGAVPAVRRLSHLERSNQKGSRP